LHLIESFRSEKKGGALANLLIKHKEAFCVIGKKFEARGE
jgi:hypothetical protein